MNSNYNSLALGDNSMNDVNCNTSVKPLNTVQKIDRCLSADFESPFSRRSLSTIEKIKIASADLLFGYKEALSVKNKLLSELINDRFFGYCTYPNALENVSLAMAKTTSYSDVEIVSVSGTLKFSSNNLFAFLRYARSKKFSAETYPWKNK